MAHSPGPWRVLPAEPDKPYLRIRGAQPGARYKIANVLPCFDGEAAYPHEVKETQDNARLIKAAPLMLQMLREALEREYNPCERDNQSKYYRRLSAAIFVATGERE